MTLPILEKERAGLVKKMQDAFDKKDQPVFDELRGHVETLNKRIADQQYLDQQSTRLAPTETADRNRQQEVAEKWNLGRAIKCAESKRWDGIEGETNLELRGHPANKDHPSNAILIPDSLDKRGVTAGTEGANTLTEDFREQDFLKVLRSKSILMSLGARQIMSNTAKVKIPRQSNTPTRAQWATEIGEATEQTMTFATPYEMSAHRLTYYTQISDQIVRESGSALPIQDIVISEGQAAMALELDHAFFAVGATQVANAPDQIWKNGTVGQITAIDRGSAATAGKKLTYDEILDMKLGTQTSNQPQMRMGFAINPQTEKVLKQTRKISGSTDSITVMQGQMVDGYPTQSSTIVPANLSKGSGSNLSAMFFSSDWNHVVVCFFGNQALTIDPYTQARTAQLRLIWHSFLDFTIVRPDSFSWYNDIITTV